MVSFPEPCDYFTVGKAKASTLSLSVIVAIEMFNALNALSEVGARGGRPRGAGGQGAGARVCGAGGTAGGEGAGDGLRRVG